LVFTVNFICECEELIINYVALYGRRLTGSILAKHEPVSKLEAACQIDLLRKKGNTDKETKRL
jgi:hypothetical protein